jgi:hypothetical protein
MKKVGDLFQELGFNEKASDDVKIAFIQNLVRAAYGVNIPSPKSPEKKPKAARLSNDEQLSFIFETALKKAN